VISRRAFLRLGASTAGASVALGAYATFVEPHWIEVTRRALPIDGLPPALAGKSLAQLSDLHIGPWVSERYVISVFEMVKSLEPDLVVFTGDYVTYRGSGRTLEGLDRVLRHLPHGHIATLGILGNHDYGPAWAHPEIAARVQKRLVGAGIHLLRNSRTQVDGLTVIGLDDLWAGQMNLAALQPLPATEPTLVLSHNPDAVDLHGWTGHQGWVLAGHTHGGQVRLPFLPPPVIPVHNPRYAAGEVDLGDRRRLYVNRGVGHLIPVRFNVRPEVTWFTLEPASRPGTTARS
jgi:predicted MPP superfamily phosphohydrolase